MYNNNARFIYIASQCWMFGGNFKSDIESLELAFHFGKAVTKVEQLTNEVFSDRELVSFSIELERLLNGEPSNLSILSDRLHCQILLLFLSYLEAVEGLSYQSFIDYVLVDFDFSNGLSGALENEYTRCIFDDIYQELIQAISQGKPQFKKISSLISDMAVYEPEVAERFRDIFDISCKESCDDK
ncbi:MULTISPECIES: hypothetical protein [unclassified Pseudoalteromonas]|uniref:hypothetical protein n=1 Tax=unclassified Pseudoalteromonas TaxID=194690 RepID=UPI00048E2164|nr:MULTISPECIES: hypothetical protein [unclassified Pseudoalteromonas]